MGYKYEDITNEYRRALEEFEDLTNIDVHEKRLRKKVDSTTINESLYHIFKRGASLADRYMLNDEKNFALLKENIDALGEKPIHRYKDGLKEKDAKNYPAGSAYEILEDAQTSFYRGAEYRIKNFTKNIYDEDFQSVAKGTRYI